MKLVMAIIGDEDAQEIMQRLLEEDFRITKLASTGGFLRAGTTTLICGCADERVAEMIDIMESKCASRKQITPASANLAGAHVSETFMNFPVEITVGGATIFVLNVEEFRQV